tara:strand:+ start:2470 stop:3354 length:885 start_codon:yes stop_codon:yes gene_type:complete
MGIITTFTFTSDTETVTRTKLNNLVANLKTEFNGSISNANVASDAAIAASKLDLSATGAIGGGTPAAGTFTTLASTGNTTIGDASGDTLTANADAWTLANGTTVTGTWDDLGTVTTVDINGGTIDGATLGGAAQVTVTDADINGGTLDGVNIGTTTATGELFVNNASDDADGLGSQGTSGQFLQSQGAGSNPTWAAGGSGSVKVGTYTGDGNATQAITGVGFQPTFVAVFPQKVGSNYQSWVQRDGDSKSKALESGGDWNTDSISAYGADGFTVRTGTRSNESGTAYTYIALDT